MRAILLIIGICCASLSAVAQKNGKEELTEEKRKEFEAQKVAFFTQEMQLTPDEAARFWPLYNEMQQKLWQVRCGYKEKRKKSSTQLTESESAEIVEACLKASQQEVDLKKEYYKKITDAISHKKLLLMFDAEHNFHKKLMKKLEK